MPRHRTSGFTIIELLIVVVVTGILAAVGLAKYQTFAEKSRRNTCLANLKAIETAISVWQTQHVAFADNVKSEMSFTVRAGIGLSFPYSGAFPLPISAGPFDFVDSDTVDTIGVPSAFVNPSPPTSGPLASILRDNKVWACPSALSRYYGGEIQNLPGDYMDVAGDGTPLSAGGMHPSGAPPVGYFGCYCVCAFGKRVGNYLWYDGLINNGATFTPQPPPVPQTPFVLAICGSYGKFGFQDGPASSQPATAPDRTLGVDCGGGPVGPDGSSLSRHSAKW